MYLREICNQLNKNEWTSSIFWKEWLFKISNIFTKFPRIHRKGMDNWHTDENPKFTVSDYYSFHFLPLKQNEINTLSGDTGSKDHSSQRTTSTNKCDIDGKFMRNLWRNVDVERRSKNGIFVWGGAVFRVTLNYAFADTLFGIRGEYCVTQHLLRWDLRISSYLSISFFLCDLLQRENLGWEIEGDVNLII